MFYVMADARQFPWLEMVPEQGREVTRISSLILRAAQDQLPVEHPNYPGVGITISQLFTPAPDQSKADIRNAVTVASGFVDLITRLLGLVHWIVAPVVQVLVQEWLQCMQRSVETEPAVPS